MILSRFFGGEVVPGYLMLVLVTGAVIYLPNLLGKGNMGDSTIFLISIFSTFSLFS